MDLFGTPQGQSLAEHDMARMAMTNAQVQHLGMQDLAIPSQIEQRGAQSRWLNARADEKGRDADIQRRVAAAAAGKEWAEDEKANPAWVFADLYRKEGAVDKSIKAAGVAATIDQKRASAATNEERASWIGTRRRIAEIDVLSRQVRTVDSPETLQAVLKQHQDVSGEQTGLLDEQGNLLPQAAEKWEEVRDKIQDMALTEKDRLATDYKERALKSADAERKSKQQNRGFWQDMGNQADRAAATRRPKQEKVGVDLFDKAEGARFGADFITSKFGNVEASQAKVLGRQLSEQARQARQLNSALTPTEAAQDAFNAMEKQGLFGGLKLKPPGALESEKRPLKLPEDGDKSRLKEGFWYTDGTVKKQWLGAGKGWAKEQSGKGASGKIGQASRPAVAYTPPKDEEDDLENDTETDDMAMEN